MPSLFLLFVLRLVFVSSAFPCEPCHPPSPAQAFQEADLVVYAKQVGSPLSSKDCISKDPTAPNHTKIKILKTLKGTLPDKEIQVRGCYGMCDYGLFLGNNRPHVIFLRSKNGLFETLTCKAKELEIPSRDLNKWLEALKKT